MIVTKSLDFGYKVDANGRFTKEPAVKFGMKRLNSDIRRIPLEWPSYRDDNAFNSGQEATDGELGTLSVVAATTTDPKLMTESRLTRLRRERRHPFTSFIPPDDIAKTSALNVLCTSPARGEVESRLHVNCAEHTSGAVEIRDVVVIGDDVANVDRHTRSN